MFLARGGGARGEPFDAGEEPAVVGFCELQPLLAGAGAGDGGIVLGGLVAVVFMERCAEDGEVAVFLVGEAAEFPPCGGRAGGHGG